MPVPRKRKEEIDESDECDAGAIGIHYHLTIAYDHNLIWDSGASGRGVGLCPITTITTTTSPSPT